MIHSKKKKKNSNNRKKNIKDGVVCKVKGEEVAGRGEAEYDEGREGGYQIPVPSLNLAEIPVPRLIFAKIPVTKSKIPIPLDYSLNPTKV